MIAPLFNIGVTKMHPLVQLRWIAVFGQIATIVFVHFVFGIALPLPMMAVVLALLIAFNLVSMWRWRNREEVADNALFGALLVDVFTLTAQLYFSGGAANPFVFLFLLQVVLGAVLLQPWASWSVAGITGACVIALTIWAGPVTIPAAHYAQGLLLCFVLNAALVVVFINRISRILRARDDRLALLRQRAAEEEHIVRMGLLASGAAHELGTPLATISVILGDWRHMPEFSANAEMLEEFADIQTQLNRCKTIVSGILLSAGEMRAESPTQTTVATFLDDLVANWRTTRPVRAFEYIKGFDDDSTIVSDEGLKQMICNVLDNALEASPNWLTLEARRDEDDLILRVCDNGPGFAPAMLAQFGRPYQSSKGRPGGGLGLFLALNVARTLGGNIAAENRQPHGAIVTMTLPLTSLMLEEEQEEDDEF
ncbi:MAG: histidine kinase, gyrase and HSP90-like ATPase family protein [Verrucomicrobiaceae bacterium]|nr:histidine kinase, gyrase and HSP90-like ATPase family protein [Verrucomicrobiaceae bacterium]